jgi:hypothetical protein
VTTTLDWDLDPADVPVVATLRYVPLLLFGGYAGTAAVAGVLALPALLSNPGLLALVGLFDGAGTVDPEAGTLTFQERTVDVATLAGVSRYRFGGVVVCRLSYAEGAGGVGSPYVVAVPALVADEVLAVLEAGVAADPGVTPRETDRTARAVLAGVALLFFATGAGIALLVPDAAVLVALVTGGLGLLFVLGSYYVA